MPINIKELYVNDAISKLCEGSQMVDNLNIKSEGNIVIAVFKAKDGIKIAELTKEEIINRVEKEDIQNDKIEDFVLMLIREKLISCICIKTTENIRRDIGKLVSISQTVNSILNQLFPD